MPEVDGATSWQRIRLGSFHHAGINSADGCKIDDGTVSCLLPHLAEDNDERPYTGHTVNLDRITARLAEQGVQRTCVIIQDVKRNGSDQYYGDEVRQEHDRLGYFLKIFIAHFIQHNSQCDLHHISQNNKYHIIKQGISGQFPQFS